MDFALPARHVRELSSGCDDLSRSLFWLNSLTRVALSLSEIVGGIDPIRCFPYSVCGSDDLNGVKHK
jgi:hypothetical protein